MAIYYHISTNIHHNGVFEPRIPSCRHKEEEDSQTPRISVAPTIEDCLTAIPNGGGRLEALNILQRGYYRIFQIDTEKLGISDKQLVLSEELYQKDLVRDADVSNEVWITTPFVISADDTFLIKLTEWDEVPLDIFPYSIYAIAEKDYEGDCFEAYMKIYQDHVPCSVGIQNAKYIQEDVEAGTEITFYFEHEEEMEEAKDYLIKHYQVDIIDDSIDEITFEVKTDCNLKNFFYEHRKIANEYC